MYFSRLISLAIKSTPGSWSPWQQGFVRFHNRSSTSAPLPWLQVSPEVLSAIQEARPVVALESTIITHGMPYPQNVETALAVESVVRQERAIPATVGVLTGQVHVGLSAEEIEWLASAEAKAVKASRRDLPYLIAQRLSGGTTVAGTMLAAHAAGIHLFVTGGVGGVHREAQNTLDVSADLRELGRTPVAVVSAGVKSILDIPRTLEYLETEGVGVFTYGTDTHFPAFYTRHSGCHAPYKVENPRDAAKVIDKTLTLDPPSGLLIAVPIPKNDALDGEEVEAAIVTATEEAKSQNICGKGITPFLLKRVNELMKGESLAANVALIKNNARVGSQIAVALSDIRQEPSPIDPQQSWKRAAHTIQGTSTVRSHQKSSKMGRVVVVGGTNVDFSAQFGQQEVVPNGATYPGSVRQSFGGVGRNLADGLARLGQNPVFLSATGHDSYRLLLQKECPHMDLSAVRSIQHLSSATYCAVLDSHGDLEYGIGDFAVHEKINLDYISEYRDAIAKAPLVVFDGNIPAETMSYITSLCRTCDVPAFFEPTDVRLVKRLFATDAWRHVAYTSPNMNELRVMHAGVTSGDLQPPTCGSTVAGSREDVLEEVLSLAKSVVDHIPNLLVTIGQHGAVLCRNTDAGSPLPYRMGSKQISIGRTMSALYVPAESRDQTDIVSVSGAGDCLVASFLTALLQDETPATCLARGIVGAEESLRSNMAVPNLAEDVISQRALQRKVTALNSDSSEIKLKM